jgi:hypothetical protein
MNTPVMIVTALFSYPFSSRASGVVSPGSYIQKMMFSYPGAASVPTGIIRLLSAANGSLNQVYRDRRSAKFF